MIALAWLAHGNARIRARKSRLLTPGVLSALVAAERPDLTVDGWRDLQVDGDAAPLLAVVYARLMGDYEAAIRAYPRAAPILRALAQLHELENIKLAWRAIECAVDPAEWHAPWRPMGRLERVSRANASASSTQQLAHVLARTPFESIARQVVRAHGADLAAAEMAFDRWGSEALLRAAERGLPPDESAALALIHLVVAERDVAVLERAIESLGVAPEAALRMTSALPRLLPRTRAPVRDFAGLRRDIRGRRRAACARAFVTNPFSLAPPIALVLMREDETRALLSIAELRARHASTAEAARALAFDG